MSLSSNASAISSKLHRMGTTMSIVASHEGANLIASHLDAKGWKMDEASTFDAVSLERTIGDRVEVLTITKLVTTNGDFRNATSAVIWASAGKAQHMGDVYTIYNAAAKAKK